MKATAHQELNDLYGEWRRLTELEGVAIGNDAWSEVARQQEQKLALRDRIVQTTERWHLEWSRMEAEPSSVRFEREFRPIVSDLIQRETRNHELICQRQTCVQSEIGALRRSSTRLRGIQRAYVGERSTRWESYS